MNKSEFIDALSARLNIGRGEAERMLNAFTDLVIDTLRTGGEVNITGFGSFTVSERAARVGVNPQKPGERIQIPASRSPKFKAGKVFKDAIKSQSASVSESFAPSAPSF